MEKDRGASADRCVWELRQGRQRGELSVNGEVGPIPQTHSPLITFLTPVVTSDLAFPPDTARVKD